MPTNRSEMKVAVLNTSDVNGGAARAAYRLHKALRFDGVDSRYIVKQKTLDDESVYADNCTDSLDRKTDQLIEKYYIARNRTEVTNTYFSEYYADTALQKEYLADVDIINLHWIDKFVSLKGLEQIVNLGKPIVWTLHDQRAFTGGCHYSAGCEAFTAECFGCIQLAADPHHLPREVLAQKAEILKNADITIVTPSRWLAEEAGKSSLFKGRRIEVIGNSLETDVFRPMDKSEAKRALGIETDAVTLMFGALTGKERRKGFPELMAALKMCLDDPVFEKACRTNKIQVIVVGDMDEAFSDIPITLVAMGTVDDDVKLATIYSATDMFVLPSLEDNLPNTMLEAMACGTPVIGFETGGIPDVVRHKKNGLIVPGGSVEILAAAIVELTFNPTERMAYSKAGRELIEEKFKLRDQAESYKELFDELKRGAHGQHEVTEVYDETIFDSVIGYAQRLQLAEMQRMAQDRTVRTVRNDESRCQENSLIKLKKELEQCRDALESSKQQLSEIKASRKYRLALALAGPYQRLKKQLGGGSDGK